MHYCIVVMSRIACRDVWSMAARRYITTASWKVEKNSPTPKSLLRNSSTSLDACRESLNASGRTPTRAFSSIAARSTANHHLESLDSHLETKVLDLFSLKNRLVVITGGAKGIGLALAFAVAEAGGRVAIVDASDNPGDAYQRLQNVCDDARYYQSDVTDYERLKHAFGEIVKDFGRIDGIITAAGVCPDESFLERDPRSVKKCVEVNNLGTYYAAQLAARQMVLQPRYKQASGAGSILMVASMAAHRACRNQHTSDYSMTKGAVLALTRQLGVELAHHSIRVNCISPGYIATDMTAELIRQRPTLGEVFTNDLAMKRMGGRSELMAASVYLLSDASSYMTSGEMLITGGCHAGAVY